MRMIVDLLFKTIHLLIKKPVKMSTTERDESGG